MKHVYEVDIAQDVDTRRYTLYVEELHAMTESLNWHDVARDATALVAVTTGLDPDEFYTRLIVEPGVQVA